MPQKVIKFSGINRKVNEFQCFGETEELINLRPDINGGPSIVKNKTVVMPQVPYSKLYEHAWGDTCNYIVSDNGIIKWVDIHKEKEMATLSSSFNGHFVDITSAGNVLVVYCKDLDKQEVFKFEKDSYVAFTNSMPHIQHARVTYSVPNRTEVSATANAEEASTGAYTDALAKATSNFYHTYPHGLCGAAIVGVTYELNDGSEVWSTAFVVADVTRDSNIQKPKVADNKVTVYGANAAYLDLTFSDASKGDVKKINIYATRPVMPYYIDGASSSFAPRLDSLNSTGLDSQLMYYQGSVTPKKNISFKLTFGDSQAAEKVMEVNQGCVTRIGKSVSLNNRFHYYDSNLYHAVQSPTASYEASSRSQNETPCIAYIIFNDGTWALSKKVFRLNTAEYNNFIYPMSGISKMLFILGEYDSSYNFSCPYEFMFSVTMEDSAAYNYSYAFDVQPSVEAIPDGLHDKFEELGLWWNNVEWSDNNILLRKETNAINVSEPYNPYVFPVKYSYSFGGEIIDIATSYLPISSTQVSQYPVTVFTRNGIYTMQQGDGSTLYSNTTAIQPLVINGKALSTPYGMFFVSSKRLYMMVGRDVISISDALDGKLETTLRENEAYKKICCNSRSLFTDFSSMLSNKDFKEYIENAVLTYDQLHNEVIISNNVSTDYYSYVFNLNTKSFYKTNKKLLLSQNGSRYVLDFNSASNVIDMYSEEDSYSEDGVPMPILLQSRPLSLEEFYTHIDRIIMLTDCNLEDREHLCISVFGSDNLHSWRCIISAQKQNTVLRHIRTNRASKSYKSYVIVINGMVKTDTDLSNIIVDYSVVNRRLG